MVASLADEVRKLAIDPGFGNYKAAEVQGNCVHVEVTPSVVGIGKTDIGWLDAIPGMRQRKQLKPITISFDGVSYLVGPNVGRYAQSVAQRLDFLRLSEGPEQKALLYKTLWNFINGGSHRVALMFGFPVEVIQDESMAEETLRRLRAWVIGEHTFSVDGQPVTVIVTQVKAIAQPAGTYFTWGLDTGGRWVQDKEAMKAPVAVVDGGFNTLDLYTLRSGNIEARYTGGEKLGMRRANEMIRNNVRERYGVEMSLHEADELVQAQMQGRKPELYCVQGRVDVSDLVRQAVDNTFAAVNAFIEEKLGNAQQFPYLLMTGGEMQVLKKSLAQHYPHAIFFPVTANAEGLAKFCVRPKVFG